MIGTKTGHHMILYKEILKRKDAKFKQGLVVERREDLQKQGRAVESEVKKDDGTCLFCFIASEAKLVLESGHCRQK